MRCRCSERVSVCVCKYIRNGSESNLRWPMSAQKDTWVTLPHRCQRRTVCNAVLVELVSSCCCCCCYCGSRRRRLHASTDRQVDYSVVSGVEQKSLFFFSFTYIFSLSYRHRRKQEKEEDDDDAMIQFAAHTPQYSVYPPLASRIVCICTAAAAAIYMRVGAHNRRSLHATQNSSFFFSLCLSVWWTQKKPTNTIQEFSIALRLSSLAAAATSKQMRRIIRHQEEERNYNWILGHQRKELLVVVLFVLMPSKTRALLDDLSALLLRWWWWWR